LNNKQEILPHHQRITSETKTGLLEVNNMNLIEQIKSMFTAHRNEEQAVPMAKYMQNNFLFLGIKNPARKILMREFYKESGILRGLFRKILF
jgi:CTP:phosphocholine cytidylyltransferase-like protein